MATERNAYIRVVLEQRFSDVAEGVRRNKIRGKGRGWRLEPKDMAEGEAMQSC